MDRLWNRHARTFREVEFKYTRGAALAAPLVMSRIEVCRRAAIPQNASVCLHAAITTFLAFRGIIIDNVCHAATASGLASPTGFAAVHLRHWLFIQPTTFCFAPEFALHRRNGFTLPSRDVGVWCGVFGYRRGNGCRHLQRPPVERPVNGQSKSSRPGLSDHSRPK